MEPTRCDDLARGLCAATSTRRRAVLGDLGGALPGTGLVPFEEAGARPHRRRRKKRKCLFGQRTCKDRRCHGCCDDGDCGGNVCEAGTCSACPRGQRPCRGGCIPQEACCADSECTGGRVCVDGACTCKPNQRECDGACIGADECCGSDCPVKTCDAENCRGCCDGTTCRDGESLTFCGRDGSFCQACNFRETCAGLGCICEKQCCRDFDCLRTNVRCNNQGNSRSCLSDGAPLPGGCDLPNVGLCCSGICTGAACEPGAAAQAAAPGAAPAGGTRLIQWTRCFACGLRMTR
jgi:hypothetical protein